MRWLLLLLCCVACDVEVLPVNLRAELDTAENRDLVEEAAARWGLGVDWRNRRRGAVRFTIHLEPIPLHGEWEGLDLHGEALDKEGCTLALWAEADPDVLAHELGHLFGQRHAKSGLMQDYPEDGAEPSARQLDSFQRHVGRWRRRCP